MQKIILAAISDNFAIGKNNDLLWHMPADLVFFNKTIKDQWLITGRKSYESAQGSDVFQKPSKTIILTRQKEFEPNGALISHDLNSAFKIAEEGEASKVFILGGGAVYKKSMPFVDTLLITQIHEKFEADVFFPSIDPHIWQIISKTDHQKDASNPYDYSFIRYERIV